MPTILHFVVVNAENIKSVSQHTPARSVLLTLFPLLGGKSNKVVTASLLTSSSNNFLFSLPHCSHANIFEIPLMSTPDIYMLVLCIEKHTSHISMTSIWLATYYTLQCSVSKLKCWLCQNGTRKHYTALAPQQSTSRWMPKGSICFFIQ